MQRQKVGHNMSEYTPETSEVKHAWMQHNKDKYIGGKPENADAEFERWLAQIQKADCKCKNG